MVRGVNKVILIGNVGVDPDIRYLPNGSPAVTLSLATSETWKDKQTGEKQERTEWHRIVCYNRLGEIVRDYIRKGSKLYIEGSLRTRKWQDQQGQDRYTTEIIANELQMLDSKGSTSASYDEMANTANLPATMARPSSQLAEPMPVAQEAFEGLDDDIPF